MECFEKFACVLCDVALVVKEGSFGSLVFG